MTARIMGFRPATLGCRCRICLPTTPADRAEALDAEDRRCIDTVLRHGWQVMLVGAAGRCSCCAGPAEDTGTSTPAFAYTVGLMHRAGHPELAMSGQSTPVMHRVLNYVAEQVVAGHRVRPGDSVEGALPTAPLTVDAVSPAGLGEIALWSSWFHRRPVEALQLVWPTVGGLFAWQPGAPSDDLDARQPRSWRVATERVGGFAPDPPWPLPVAPDAMAFICAHVRRDGEPIRAVNRAPGVRGGEDWMFSCGRDHSAGVDDLLTEHIAHTVRSAPSLREIADLPMDAIAERPDAFHPWKRRY